jgi:hypothetical protein
MTTTHPTFPHTASMKRFQDPAGNSHSRIAVEFAVPSRVAAMLPESGGLHTIPSAGIGLDSVLKIRARGWKHGFKRGGLALPALRTFLAPAAAEGCNAPITIAITPDEWHLVGMLCGILRITPGQWFVACAAYNAGIEEAAIEAQLAALDDTQPRPRPAA